MFSRNWNRQYVASLPTGGVFAACGNLQTVSIGVSIATIRSDAFANCENLQIVSIHAEEEDVNIAHDAFPEDIFIVFKEAVQQWRAGADGAYVTVSAYDDGTIALLGTGAMQSFAAWDEVPWKDAIESGDYHTLIIGKGITVMQEPRGQASV